jgi:hypothetical protein
MRRRLGMGIWSGLEESGRLIMFMFSLTACDTKTDARYTSGSSSGVKVSIPENPAFLSNLCHFGNLNYEAVSLRCFEGMLEAKLDGVGVGKKTYFKTQLKWRVSNDCVGVYK